MTKEIEMVKKNIYNEIVVNKEETVYDPDRFREFCIAAGTTKLFDSILGSITSSRHSSDRICLNKKGCFIHLQFVLLTQPNMNSSSN